MLLHPHHFKIIVEEISWKRLESRENNRKFLNKSFSSSIFYFKFCAILHCGLVFHSLILIGHSY